MGTGTATFTVLLKLFIELVFTRTGSLDLQSSTLTTALAVPTVFCENRSFCYPKVFLNLFNAFIRKHIKHYFETTSAHSTVPEK